MLNYTTRLKLISLWGLFLNLLIVLDANVAFAQNIISSAGTSCKSAEAKIKDVYNGKPGVKDAELGDIITLEIENLLQLSEEAKCLNKRIILYLDGKPLNNAELDHPTDPQTSILYFPLKRTDDAKNVWTYILRKPTWKSRVTQVSVGIEDKFSIPSNSKINLQIMPYGLSSFWLALLIVILVIFLFFAHKSDMLRDSVSPLSGERRTYSLARVQAAWWFFIILGSYLFIGIITGDFNTTITGTVLGLFGISAGTTVCSAFVDAGKSTPVDIEKEITAIGDIQNKIKNVDKEIKDKEEEEKQCKAPNDTKKLSEEKKDSDKEIDDKKKEEQQCKAPNDTKKLSEVKAKLAEKRAEKKVKGSQLKKLNSESEGILIDILSDIHGVSFHRFQMLALTIVLGIIFVIQVYETLAMPNFDGTLLALLGISAGTYLGLKVPEDNVPKK